MKNGYDQFFKSARQAQAKVNPRTHINDKMNDKKMSQKEIIENIQKKMKVQKKKKIKAVPWRVVTTSFLGFSVAITGYLNLEKVEKIFQKIEISLLGQAYANEEKNDNKNVKTDKAIADNADNKKPVAGAEPAKPAPDAATEKIEKTNGDIDHFSKLNERKKDLDAKEQELNKIEIELQQQKAELEKRLIELEKTRKSISQVLEDKVQADDKKVETLVQVYSNMKPQQAAKVFETMDEDLAVEIMGRMKKKNAAEIMNLIKPEKAQIFSEKYAGYKRSKQ